MSSINPIQVGKKLKISTGKNVSGAGGNRLSAISKSWTDIVERLNKSKPTKETAEQYARMDPTKKAKLKDTGYFIGGQYAKSGIRHGMPEFRVLLALDMDYGPKNYAAVLADKLEGFEFIAHSTHSHTEDSPRLRIVLPLLDELPAEKYVALSRLLADRIGIELFDHTSHQAGRAMFWPSHPHDIEPVFIHQKGSWINGGEYIDSNLADWRDTSSYPRSERETKELRFSTEKAEDPLTKEGFIGAFCNAYSIREAIARFLEEDYIESTDMVDRFSYAGSTTINGAAIYDDKFLYSYHEKDPCSGRLVNAFDLVRIHKFGELDDKVKDLAKTPVGKLPSFKAMKVELEFDDAMTVSLVSRRLPEETQEEIKKEKEDTRWMGELRRNDRGDILPTYLNIILLIENDANLKGKLAFNELKSALVRMGDVPWAKCEDKDGGDTWSDTDDLHLRAYLEKKRRVEVNKNNAHDATNKIGAAMPFDPVKKYLDKLEWDGVGRLDSLMIDFLGCEDNPYTRAVSSKMLIAAVARVYVPGIKFDHACIIEGRQGLGKSTFIATLCPREDWFSDAINSFSGKEAVEDMQGTWIMEMPELSAFRKSKIEEIKSFITRQVDKSRMVFERRRGEFPRRCVLFGTTNDTRYLKDDSGNRRFWPIKSNLSGPLDIKGMVAIRDQIWAEAKHRYGAKESLYISDAAIMELAKSEQDARFDEDERFESIKEWLSTDIPEDYWTNLTDFPTDDIAMVKRDRTCIAEIAEKCLKIPTKDLNVHSQAIRSMMSRMPGWEVGRSSLKFGGKYGRYSQRRGYIYAGFDFG